MKDIRLELKHSQQFIWDVTVKKSCRSILHSGGPFVWITETDFMQDRVVWPEKKNSYKTVSANVKNKAHYVWISQVSL